MGDIMMNISFFTSLSDHVRDLFEITLLCAGYFFVTTALCNQHDKKLLYYWYGYHAALMISYGASLYAIFFLLGSLFPVVGMLFIILYEPRLQKMFVVPRTVDPLMLTNASSHWIDELIKFSLIRLHEQKDLSVIIEYGDKLHTLITTDTYVQADLKKNTLALLYDSFVLPQDHFLWITHRGTIVSLAARWKNHSWQDTMRLTAACDCIALHLCPVTRSFTIIHGSKIIERVTAHHALNMLHELHLITLKNLKDPHVSTTHDTTYNDTTFPY